MMFASGGVVIEKDRIQAAELTPEVRAAFAGLPEELASQLHEVRSIAFAVAEEIPETGGLHEYLAWGQPSLRPKREGVGTAIRLGVGAGGQAAMFVHCATSLISEYKIIAGHLMFEGKRAVLLPRSCAIPEPELRVMIELAFTSKLRQTG